MPAPPIVSRHDPPVAITTHDEWQKHGGPASKDHWVRGRSAWELACDWIERDAADRVVELLTLRPELAGLTLNEGVAEKQTHFDEQRRGPRNHDLLVRAIANVGRVTIGIEGKADESFDDPVWLWQDKRLKASPDSGAPARIDRLTRQWFGTTLRTDHDHPPLACIGYQLFSALAGTLADAKADGSAIAVLLVQEFDTDRTEPSKHDVNARVLDDFVRRLGGPDLERSGTDAGWITGPTHVRGDGVWTPTKLPVCVAKLRRVVEVGPSLASRRSQPSARPLTAAPARCRSGSASPLLVQSSVETDGCPIQTAEAVF